MKKLILIVLFLSGLTLAQNLYMKQLDFGTVANSVTETQYVAFDEFKTIDSISVIAFGTGELDVDSVDFYVGMVTSAGKWFSSTANTATVTLNLAAATAGHELLVTSNATLLTGALLRGGNAIKVVTRGATSGNDATDPNRLYLVFRVWGTR